MRRPLNVEEWISSEKFVSPDGQWTSMMSRVASFHQKFEFSKPENKGHDMGYRIALTVEELGEFSAAITKGKTKKAISEELSDLLILIMGHALALEVDLEKEFHDKMDIIMKRKSKMTDLGIRVTEYKD